MGGTRVEIREILKLQTLADLPVPSRDKHIAFVEDEAAWYWYDADNSGGAGVGWFPVGTGTSLNAMIVVSPETNNKPTDAAAFPGTEVVNGDESFTIQDGLDLAETLGGAVVYLPKSGYVINNATYPNQIFMRSNVELRCGFGTRVYTRTSAQPDGGIINFYKESTWAGGPASRTVDTTAMNAERGREVVFIELGVGVGATVAEGGLVVWEGQTKRIERISSDTIFLDSTVKLQENSTLSGSLDYHPPEDVVENAKCTNMKLMLSPQGWDGTTYSGAFAFYACVWCEVEGTIFEGDEFDYGTPANSNFPWAGLIYSENTSGVRFRDNLCEKITSGILYGFNTTDFDFIDNKLYASSGPDGFGSRNPQWGLWFDTGWDNLRIRDNIITIGVEDDYLVGICFIEGLGFEEVVVERNQFKSTGNVNGVIQAAKGLDIYTVSRAYVHGNTIAAGGAFGSGIRTMTIGEIPKVVITENALRASGNLDFSIASSIRMGFSGVKPGHEAIFSNNYAAEGLEQILDSNDLSTSQLDLDISSYNLQYANNFFNVLQITSNGGWPAPVVAFEHPKVGNAVQVELQPSYTATTSSFVGNFYITLMGGIAAFNYDTEDCSLDLGTTAAATVSVGGCHRNLSIVEAGAPGTLTVSGEYYNCNLNDGGVSATPTTTNINSGTYRDTILGSGSTVNVNTSGSGKLYVSNCALSVESGGVMTIGGANTLSRVKSSSLTGKGTTSDLVLDDRTSVEDCLVSFDDIDIPASADNVKFIGNTWTDVTGPAVLDINATATRVWVVDNAVESDAVITDSSGAAAIRDNLS